MKNQAKYTLGHIITGRMGRPERMSNPRPLFHDGEQIAVVDSDAGPVVVGAMTEAQARKKFPAAFKLFASIEE